MWVFLDVELSHAVNWEVVGGLGGRGQAEQENRHDSHRDLPLRQERGDLVQHHSEKYEFSRGGGGYKHVNCWG